MLGSLRDPCTAERSVPPRSQSRWTHVPSGPSLVPEDRTCAMSVSIRELKHRYKLHLAEGRALPTHDLGIALPLSTGNPLFDAALTDKLVATTTLNEPEHLNRGWHLVRNASNDDLSTLAAHARALLNDYKLLLALHSWSVGDEERCRQFLDALPWRWRLGFPTAVIKPGAQLFTGWRRDVEFRLVDDPRFPALRELFREILVSAPPVALLKYRSTIKQSAALLKFRFEGDRERAIHDLCFHKGRSGSDFDALEPIGTCLRAQEALRVSGVPRFLHVLEKSEHEIPITSYMGLLGSARIRLADPNTPERNRLRSYAVRSATAVESLLRLNEWGSWLDDEQADTVARKVRHGIIERGLDVPFLKVVKAFIAAPQGVRKQLLEPMLLPLMRHFGERTRGLLPEPSPVTFVQPANVIHIMSFLLYAVLSTSMPTKLLLLRGKGSSEVEPIPVEEVGKHLADDPSSFENWLLSTFGGLSSQWSYTYDWSALHQAIGGLDPEAPVVLDLPFVGAGDVLGSLLPFERIFNLNCAYGAPGEVCVAHEYYQTLLIGTSSWSYGAWARYSDASALRFTEFLERLGHFQRLAEAS